MQGKKTKIGYIATSLLLVLLGLCMVIWPIKAAELICTVLGIILLVIAVVMIFKYLSLKEKATADQFKFAVGVIIGIFGIILLFGPDWILAMIHVLLGIAILFDGVFKVTKAFEAKRNSLEKWWLVLSFAALTCICGLVLIFNPFAAQSVLMTIIGVIFLIEGIQNFWVAIYAMKS